MKTREVQCKTALSSSTLPGLTYCLNPYRGCMHHCSYCYAPNVLRIPRDDWGHVVEIKKNIPVVLSKELKSKKPGVVGISTVTDPYQPLEQQHRLTRFCLEQLLLYDFPVHIQTKSALVTRDIDLLSRFSDVQVMVSIGTLHDNERRLLEPNTSSIQDRFSALKKCADSGLRTAVFFGPVYPTTALGEIPQLLDILKDIGVQEVWIDMLRLKPGVWQNICMSLGDHQDIMGLFVRNVLEETSFYKRIREETLKEAKKRNITVIDAF